MNGMTIVDADGHIVETDAELRARLPERFRQRGGGLAPSDAWDRFFGGRLRDPAPSMETRLRDMDLEGIDVAVLYPTRGLAFPFVREREYAVALCRAYNDFIADVCRAQPRLKGVGLLPLQSIPDAVAEMRRAVTELGLVGVMVPAHGHWQVDLGTEPYFPLYAEAERLDCPVALHAATTNAWAGERFDTLIKVHTVAQPLQQMVQLTGLVLGGVPAQFPRLRLAILEAGVGWLPWIMERLDEEYELRREEAPLLDAKPSEYMRSGRLYYSCEPDEGTLPYVIDRLGEDVILYASDYPHWDCRCPNSVRAIAERDDLAPGVKAKVLGKNAQRFYKLS